MSGTTVQARSTTDTGGWICFWGGLVGAVQAVIMLLWTPEVGADRYSYPMTPGGYVVAQLTFAVQHVALLVGLVALARSAWTARSRPARVGAWASAAGMALLTIMEAVAILAASEPTGSATATLVDSLYGIPTIVLGVALVVCAVALVRDRSLGAGPRWMVLVLGVYVFVVLLPGIVTGSYTLARIAIGVWMLGFAMLGFLLARRSEGCPHPLR